MTIYFVENDNLSDDWPSFDTRAEAVAWIKEKCLEIAKANEGKGRFTGMTVEQAAAQLYEENEDCIRASEV